MRTCSGTEGKIQVTVDVSAGHQLIIVPVNSELLSINIQLWPNNVQGAGTPVIFEQFPILIPTEEQISKTHSVSAKHCIIKKTG